MKKFKKGERKVVILWYQRIEKRKLSRGMKEKKEQDLRNSR